MKYWAAFVVANASLVASLYLIQREKINLKSKRLSVGYLLSLILLIITFEYASPSYKVIFNILIYILISYFLFRKDAKNSIIAGLMIIVLNIVSEFIYILVSSPFVNHELFILQEWLMVFVQNCIIGLLIVLLSYLVGKKNLYYRLIKAINKVESYQLVILSMLFIVLFNFFIWITCFISFDLLENSLLVIIGSAISLFSVIFFFVYLKTNSSYKVVSEKYNLSLKSIEDYEKMIDESKLNNHEVRNQFLIIRNMSKNKKIINYIDTLLDNKINDNELLLAEVSRLPRGGLRGLVYSKLLTMKEKKINYNLLIDRKVSMTKFNKLDDNNIVDVCKILGVFLDNAIEAVDALKEKDIVIEIYADVKDIVIAITNNFESNIDWEKLDTTRYSTKGDGRGYGLTLVKEIIQKSNKLENLTEIYEDNFTQKLKIKM